jgi:hypothetical protein
MSSLSLKDNGSKLFLSLPVNNESCSISYPSAAPPKYLFLSFIPPKAIAPSNSTPPMILKRIMVISFHSGKGDRPLISILIF